MSEDSPAYGPIKSAAIGEMDRTAPERIWLQVDPRGDPADRGEPFPACDGLTWWVEPIGGQEVEYVRADLVAAPAGDSLGVARLREALEWLPKSTGRWIAVGRQVENECDEIPDICFTGMDQNIEWPSGDEDECALADYIAACQPDAIRELLIRLDEARRKA